MTRKRPTIDELIALENEQARRDAADREPGRRIDAVVEAIGRYTTAKITYEREVDREERTYAAADEVDKAREHLTAVLTELLATEGGQK